ncbi:predicted protein [Aspergillus terreus NIH2624]|uniref:Protein kinase domain-containing protein n=1 Tax=Aspergillus terreus (strain NIH 2624 / FGSC A1156) TaxID=341663 RepID=Q0C975_ASPTN|nr:uncharacterized protein ATEG_09759 [Aspergillus terreus NIH2624]EAU29950.1 predicted protein [Aspergillus terreus NIH2624]
MDPGTIITLVDMCYRIGAKLIDVCSTWRHAETEVEKRVIIVESCWDRTKRQVDFVVRITPIMDADHCRVIDELLNQLLLSLSIAVNTLEEVAQRPSPSRPKIFLSRFRSKAAWVWQKEALDNVVSELEAWQRRFDPSWYLLIKIASPILDTELAKAKAAEAKVRGPATAAKTPLALAAGLRNVLSPSKEQTRSLFLPEMQMEWADIPFSDARAGRRQDARGDKWYIVDTIEVGDATRVSSIARDVRVLAAKLAQADPLAFGLLNCKGVVAVPRPDIASAVAQQFGESLEPPTSAPPRLLSPSPGQREYSQFQIIFRSPQDIEKLRSLRQLLLDSDDDISLSRKINISRELGKAVNYVHTFAFVHKNIRPESVLCFEMPQSKYNHSVLVGFDAFRAADAGTLMEGDMTWARNVYRHPNRQGTDPSEKYNMRHDIYSLGVCLLEIGLWKSFVKYEDPPEASFNSPSAPQSKFGEPYYDFIAWCQRKSPISSFNDLAWQLKNFLVEQASTRLAQRMGDKYAQVVVSCLTCLDADNESFGDLETEDVDDDVIGVRFIENIMKVLDRISL